MTHKLKTIQPFYEHVDSGAKTFEVRKNDRNFQAGDIMVLQEFDHQRSEYSGNEIKTIISYVLRDKEYVKDGFVILGFKKI